MTGSIQPANQPSIHPAWSSNFILIKKGRFGYFIFRRRPKERFLQFFSTSSSLDAWHVWMWCIHLHTNTQMSYISLYLSLCVCVCVSVTSARSTHRGANKSPSTSPLELPVLVQTHLRLGTPSLSLFLTQHISLHHIFVWITPSLSLSLARISLKSLYLSFSVFLIKTKSHIRTPILLQYTNTQKHGTYLPRYSQLGNVPTQAYTPSLPYFITPSVIYVRQTDR